MQHTASTKSDSTAARHHDLRTDQYTTHTWRERQTRTGPARPSSNHTLASLLCTWPCSSRDGFSSSCFVTSR